jgi:hypothetical protein
VAVRTGEDMPRPAVVTTSLVKHYGPNTCQNFGCWRLAARALQYPFVQKQLHGLAH